MNADASRLISKLGLIPLPREGGFFARSWTSPRRDFEGRPAGSAILFLITEEEFSALHRLGEDELWHFHAGDPAELTLLEPMTGRCWPLVMGPDVVGPHIAQAVVPAGVWQGARIRPGGHHGWTLFGCSLSPAWDEREFELGDRGTLLREFPAHEPLIRQLTR